MKYIKLFENFKESELLINAADKKGEMIVRELEKPEPNLNRVRELIISGANVDWKGRGTSTKDGYSALNLCAADNYLEFAKMLIDAGADVNVQGSDDGKTALHNCAYMNYPEFAKMLIDAGADVNVQTSLGSTALHMCAYEKGREIAKQMLIAKMLIDAGVDVNVQNSVGSTALHVSAYENDLELTKMLLDAGADKTISNDVGLPYEIADNQELKELLQP